MKNLAILVLTIITIGQAEAQKDKNGNPVFNSVTIDEKTIDDYLLVSNYYTLKNNIENIKSSVFISEKPSLDQIEKAAINLTSDFFILTKESKMVVMILLQNDPKRQFTVIEMAKNKQSTYMCKLTGDISENRANEIIKEGYDPTAAIENGKLTFNGKLFNIITNKDLEDAVLKLIKAEKLDKKKPSKAILLSQKEMKKYILTQSKVGGKLDFFTEIKGKENDGVQIKPGVFTTLQSVALYKWGRACYEIGISSIDDAYEIYAEHTGKPVSSKDKEYIRMGFNKEWE